MSATSSNHAEILAIHEASQEAPTVVHEDNAACIAQLKDGYIKDDRTKHILPKFFSLITCRRVVTLKFKRSVQAIT
ncbi:hypothetical protein Tco_0903165 [Tanacetum coccineum]